MSRGAARPAFELSGATVRFGDKAALAGVDLRVAPGEAVALVGPSGSGKTTLLRLLNGTVRPSAGSVRVAGEELAALGPQELRRVRSRIGFIHQDLALVPNVRVLANVLAGRLGRRGLLGSFAAMLRPPMAEVEAAHEILERVGIGDKLYQRTDRLSGGEKQRVAIARALFQEPIALLADEPVSSVDPARARDVVALLTEISRERDLTLVMSLHNLELAREFFPRLVGLRRGAVAFDRPTAALPDEEFRALYDLAPHELLADAR